MTKTYTIFGCPTPLARARHAGGHVYDNQKNSKLIFGITLRELHDEKPLFKGPLHLDIVFYMPISNSWSDKKKNERSCNYHVIKPDISNLLKFVEDCATGILYRDDCVICSVNMKKIYDDGEKPRTVLTIKELG